MNAPEPASTRHLSQREAVAVAGVQRLRFFPLEIVSARGCVLTAADGRELLDFTASWTANGLGHADPMIRDAVRDAVQAPAGASILSAVHPEAVALAEELLAAVPVTTDPTHTRVYLGHAGTDANDVAVRGCRQATGRTRIVAFDNGYHGGLGTAQGISGVHVAAGVTPDPAVTFVPYPDPLRPERSGSPAGASPGELTSRVLGLVEQALSGRDVAGLVVEPIQSDGGQIVPPPGFLPGLRGLCDRYGTLLVVDEVKVGMGRTGRFLAHQHEGVVPDLVTLGKALGGGLPLSAAVGPAAGLDEPVASALLTTIGNPVCCAAGRAVLARLRDGSLAGAAAARGAQLLAGLDEYAGGGRPGAGRIGQVRGRGLTVGVELVAGPGAERPGADGPAPDDLLAAKTAYRAWELGLVCYPVRGNVLELTPPLIVSAAQIDQGVDLLTRALDDAVAGAVPDETIAPYAGWA